MLLTDAFPDRRAAATNIMKRLEIETVEEAQSKTDEELLKCPYVGRKFLEKIRSYQTKSQEPSMGQRIKAMRLHDSLTTTVNGDGAVHELQIIRVMNGWLYVNSHQGREASTPIFVPEFV